MRNQIRLETLKDMNDFVNIASQFKGNIHLTDSCGLCVSAKSLLGVMYSMEFDEVWIESDEDIYHAIERFIVE